MSPLPHSPPRLDERSDDFIEISFKRSNKQGLQTRRIKGKKLASLTKCVVFRSKRRLMAGRSVKQMSFRELI